MDCALSNEQVEEVAGKDITLVLNKDMNKYNNLSELFKTPYVLINYMTAKNYGHWVGLHLSDDGKKVTFFDSYGKIPDGQINFIPLKYRIESNQDYPHLSKLLLEWLNEDKENSIRYNDVQLQRYSSKVQTCGRWVGLYFKYCDDMSVEDFAEMMESYERKLVKGKKLRGVKKDLVLDELVVELTS